jgi:hypothetical protein
MFRPSYQTEELAAYLKENVGIDAAVLASGKGVHEHQIIAYQRKLGLRPITTSKKRRKS